MKIEKEIWKDVLNYEGYYQVSNLGNVKCLPRRIEYFYGGDMLDIRVRHRKGHICKTNKAGKSKYLMVRLTGKSKYKLVSIHTIVASAFLGYVINKKHDVVVDHIDNNKLNNNVNNLQLLSARKNISKSKMLKNKTSQYTGVYWKTKNKKWCASIHHNKKVHIGLFDDEHKAHLAYSKYILDNKL